MKIEIGSEEVLLKRMMKADGVDRQKAVLLMQLAKEAFLKFLSIMYPSFMVHLDAAIYFSDIEIHGLDDGEGWLEVEMKGHACLHIEEHRKNTYVAFVPLWHSCEMPR